MAFHDRFCCGKSSQSTGKQQDNRMHWKSHSNDRIRKSMKARYQHNDWGGPPLTPSRTSVSISEQTHMQPPAGFLGRTVCRMGETGAHASDYSCIFPWSGRNQNQTVDTMVTPPIPNGDPTMGTPPTPRWVGGGSMVVQIFGHRSWYPTLPNPPTQNSLNTA